MNIMFSIREFFLEKIQTSMRLIYLSCLFRVLSFGTFLHPLSVQFWLSPQHLVHDHFLNLFLSLSGNSVNYPTSIQHSFLLRKVPANFCCLLLRTLINTNCVKYHVCSDDLKIYISIFNTFCRHIPIPPPLKSLFECKQSIYKTKFLISRSAMGWQLANQSIVFVYSTSIAVTKNSIFLIMTTTTQFFRCCTIQWIRSHLYPTSIYNR